jgi:hypothetical protein
VYCAGVTEPLDSRSDLWDLYVDLPALSISVADGARKDFTMTSVHKDVAGALINAYADGEVQSSLGLHPAQITGVLSRCVWCARFLE